MKGRPGRWPEIAEGISIFGTMTVSLRGANFDESPATLDRPRDNLVSFAPPEQTLEHGAQTPPPSPFSVQAFNRATTSNGAQGFDYGISNNKGNADTLSGQMVLMYIWHCCKGPTQWLILRSSVAAWCKTAGVELARCLVSSFSSLCLEKGTRISFLHKWCNRMR